MKTVCKRMALAVCALAILLCAASLVEAGLASNAAAPQYADGFNNGIFGPDTVTIARSLCCVWVPIADYFTRLPTMGIPRASLSGPIGSAFSMGGENGNQLRGEIGIYDYKGPSPTSVIITVTDGYSTLSKTITVVFTDNGQGAITPGNIVLDTRQSGSSRWPTDQTMTIAYDPAGIIDTRDNYWVATQAALTAGLKTKWGRVKATLTLSGGGVQQTEINVISEREAIVSLTWLTTPLYSNIAAGTNVAQFQWWSEAGVNSVIFPGNSQFIVAANGFVSVNSGLAVGTGQTLNVVVTSNSGKTTNVQFTYDVVQGIMLPSTTLTLTQGKLNNHHRGQQVGQVGVTLAGFVPTAWSLFNRNSIDDPYSGHMDLFVINATSGYISSPSNAKIPARTHKVSVTATDGPRTVTATFDVVVDAFKGPTYYVGRGMAALHPGVGYETLHEAMQLCVTSYNQDLPDERAGWTIMVAYDSDPNYYANDNGARTTDWGMRFGWHGPGTIRAMDLNGPRPRIGGTTYVPNGGGDMGGKGFVNIDSGDITLINLEISWCNGDGAPDSDMTHGISCVRKNAGTWGDLTVDGCYIHDANNGIESGTGAYDVYVRNSVLGNAGTQYVSSGATHASYLGGCGYVEVINNLYYHTINGHNIKARAFSGLIRGNRIYDGERGGASSQIDMPNGGRYVIEDNDIWKGPNAQSYSAILFAEESTNGGRPHSLLVQRNKIAVALPNGNHFGDGVGVSIAHINPYQFQLGAFAVKDNSYFLGGGQVEFVKNSVYGDGAPGGIYPNISVTGNTQLTEPFRLDFSDPGTAVPQAPRLGWIVRSYDGNGDNFRNFGSNQINPGSDDMRVWVGASVGTEIGRCVANGSLAWAASSDPNHRLLTNPFDTTEWKLLQDAQAYYGNLIVVAPASRYKIDSATGSITLGESLSAAGPGMDYIVVQATATSGLLATTTVWFRFYISRTAAQDPAVIPPRTVYTSAGATSPFPPDPNTGASGTLPSTGGASGAAGGGGGEDGFSAASSLHAAAVTVASCITAAAIVAMAF